MEQCVPTDAKCWQVRDEEHQRCDVADRPGQCCRDKLTLFTRSQELTELHLMELYEGTDY